MLAGAPYQELKNSIIHTRHASRTHLLSKDDANFQPNHPAHIRTPFFLIIFSLQISSKL
jgi:hypothetical protein